jgi:hypothetical protein
LTAKIAKSAKKTEGIYPWARETGVLFACFASFAVKYPAFPPSPLRSAVRGGVGGISLRLDLPLPLKKYQDLLPETT